MCEHDPKPARGAFTLVEMLVVMAIIIVLATIAVMIMPHITERTKAARGADNLQGWLLISRETALRDRVPRGLRLIIDPTTRYVSTLQYIEQPDNLNIGNLYYNVGNPNQVDIVGFDGSGGLGLNNQGNWPVQPGDFLQIQSGPSLKITAVLPNLTATPVTTSLQTLSPTYALALGQPPVLPPLTIGNNFAIIRAPRPRPSEAPLQLPTDIVIDMNQSIPGAIPGQYDIMFAPSGNVIGTLGNTTGKVILWVRDSTQDPANPGTQELITVFTRTGLIGAFPVNLAGPDPYFYTRDPRNSGM
jgi:prepilin-type N-terminal cleavage/methylation domain-containing protein